MIDHAESPDPEMIAAIVAGGLLLVALITLVLVLIFIIRAHQ